MMKAPQNQLGLLLQSLPENKHKHGNATQQNTPAQQHNTTQQPHNNATAQQHDKHPTPHKQQIST